MSDESNERLRKYLRETTGWTDITVEGGMLVMYPAGLVIRPKITINDCGDGSSQPVYHSAAAYLRETAYEIGADVPMEERAALLAHVRAAWLLLG